MRLSANPDSHQIFLKDDGATNIPALLSVYINKNWLVVRSATLVIRNLLQSDVWKQQLMEKEGYKHIVRAMAHFLKNCQSIVYVCVDILKTLIN